MMSDSDHEQKLLRAKIALRQRIQQRGKKRIDSLLNVQEKSCPIQQQTQEIENNTPVFERCAFLILTLCIVIFFLILFSL